MRIVVLDSSSLLLLRRLNCRDRGERVGMVPPWILECRLDHLALGTRRQAFGACELARRSQSGAGQSSQHAIVRMYELVCQRTQVRHLLTDVGHRTSGK